MRHSVFTTFHVDAPDKVTATAAVNAILDLVFSMHRGDITYPDTFVSNAVTTRCKSVTQEA